MRWRPHAKMHKSAAIALLQVQAGAVGVCVQKTAEAEAMVAGGVNDVYISNEVIARPKLARVAALARTLAQRQGQLSIAVDSLEGIRRLAQAMADDAEQQASGDTHRIQVYIEIDVGQNRCGVPPGEPALVLAQEIVRHKHLHLAGLQAYHGRAQHLRTAAERRQAIALAVEAARHTRRRIAAAGIPVDLVTGAGTGSFALETASGVYGELQTGSFLFMDADYAANQASRDPSDPQHQAPAFEHALFVKSQVISTQLTHAVCDAGHKSHAVDSGLPRVHGLDLDYTNGGDEHGILRAHNAQTPLPALGDTVWLIPGHCDPTVNLHDHMIGVRTGPGGTLDSGVVERLFRVDARGALT
jgi:D-serine deaminase-like pyridoxal phosphate-dependent protein